MSRIPKASVAARLSLVITAWEKYCGTAPRRPEICELVSDLQAPRLCEPEQKRSGNESAGHSVAREQPLEQARLQLTRDPRPLPRMELNPEIKNIHEFKFEDFQLLGYDPHPSIKAPIAV